MRKPIVAGNWKMHKTPAEAVEFANQLKSALGTYTAVEQVVIPPYIALSGVQDVLAGTQIKVGAQDVHHEEKGAYTSSIAATMLVGLVEYVVIGHSETRQYLNVTDELVNKKVKAALAHGLKPIIAIGESLEQRDAGQAEAVCKHQLVTAFKDIPADALAPIVIAYEPIWAIGTGRNAEAGMVNELLGGTIRATIADLYGSEAAQAIRIQYGGSVKPSNMLEYMGQPEIDGALVGGASLELDSFKQLIQLTAQAKNLA